MPDDLTNRSLAKFLSIENIGSLIVIAFLFGGVAYANQETANKVDALIAEKKEFTRDVNAIKLDIALMKKEQSYIKHHIEEQNKDLKEVINLLKRR